MYKSVVRSTVTQLTSAARPAAVRGFAAHATPQPFNWEDPLDAKSLLTEEEIAISETAEAYCQERMLPRVLGLSSNISASPVLIIAIRGISKRKL